MFNPAQGPQNDGSETPASAPNPKVAPTPELPVQPHMKAGVRLRAAREALGLSLAQVSGELRIKADYLAALETMNVNLIPGKAFARAYLRDYAKRLGLSPADTFAQYESECARLREDAEEPIRNPRSKPGQERPWFWALTLAVVCAAFIGYRALRDRGEEDAKAAEAPAVAASTAPAPAVVETAPADDPWSTKVVVLRARAPAWLEVRGSDGTIFLSRTLQAGETYRPDVGAGWTLHTRDGGAFEIVVNGVPAGLLGDAGAPVLGRQVDRIEEPAAPVTVQVAG